MATQLVNSLVAEINRAINFGGSEAKLIRAFEIFLRNMQM